MRNLSQLLECSSESESRKRLRFLRSLAPNPQVFRDSDGFFCGMCGCSQHKREEALSCLRRCLREAREKGVLYAPSVGEVYLCPVCSRKFARREDAIDCHGRQRRLSKIYLSDVPEKGIRDWDNESFYHLQAEERTPRGRLLDAPLRLETLVPLQHTHDFSKAKSPDVPLARAIEVQSVTELKQAIREPEPEPKVIRPKVVPSQPPEPAPQKMIDHEEEGPPVSVAVPEPVAPPVTPEPVEEDTSFGEIQAPEEEEESGPFREPSMKPFKRHDAKYVCSACGSTFFTRSDVEECFFSHPERKV